MYLKTISSNDYQHMRIFERSVLFMQNDSSDAILISTIAPKRDYEIDDMLNLWIHYQYRDIIAYPDSPDYEGKTAFLNVNDPNMKETFFLMVKDGKIIKKNPPDVNGNPVGSIFIRPHVDYSDEQYPYAVLAFENQPKLYTILNPDGEFDLDFFIDKDTIINNLKERKWIEPKYLETVEIYPAYNKEKTQVLISAYSLTPSKYILTIYMDLNGNIMNA